MSSQPTELERVMWWLSGWRRKYVHAFDADRMTNKIDVRDIAACLRYSKTIAENLAAERKGGK